MNSIDIRRQIHRFLKGRYRKEVDTFCIYQWVDRCYFHGWWDLGAKLASSIPPNSLNQEYHKRLEYLLSECRTRLKNQFVELKSPKGTKIFSIPKSFCDICDGLGIKPGGSSNRRLRLEYLGEKVVLLETIKSDKCTFYFSDWGRDKLIDWLNAHEFGHLKENIRPKKGTGRQRARLIGISWEEASNLILILHEEVKGIATLIEEIQKGSPDVIEKIREILKSAKVIDD